MRSKLLKVQEVPIVGEQKAAREKMLASPCPYCSNPQLYLRELGGRSQREVEMGINPIGKFWGSHITRGYMARIKSHFYGDHWRIRLGGELFSERFREYTIEIASFPADYSPWHFANYALLTRLTASPEPRKFPFDVCRITHKRSPIIVEAHTWFSHRTMITMHGLPTANLPSEDVTVMQGALEFFRPETRGAPKVDKAKLVQAVMLEGMEATQKSVAKRLGVTDRAIRDWLAREGLTWEQFKIQADLTEFLKFKENE
jgi:hypothetical protein